MIWSVDPLTFCLATLILTAAILSLDGWSRGSRLLVVLLGSVVYGSISLVFKQNDWQLGTVGPPLSSQKQFMMLLAGIAAGMFAIIADNRKTGYWFSIVTLLCLGVAFAMAQECPVAIAGLMHQIGLADITACCIASTLLGISGPSQLEPKSNVTEGPDEHNSDAGRRMWVSLPDRLVRRSGIMFVIVCMSLAYSLWFDKRLFGLPDSLGLWAGGSEIVAAVVAWRVTSRWVHPGQQLDKSPLKLRLGLFAAGVAAGLGLLLMPVIIAAAAGLN